MGMIAFKSDEIYQYFWYDETSYVIKYSDIKMSIIKVSHEPKLHVIPISTSDWLCFLREKFGKRFSEHYANMFNAEDIIFDEAKFVSRLSFDDVKAVLSKIYEQDFRKTIPFAIDDDVEITEANSFFNSERRFLIMKISTKEFFFLRISDFQVIKPRMSPNLYRRFMIGKFGNEYVNMLEI